MATACFYGPLDIRKVSGVRWMTLSSLIYDSEVAARRIVVPAEFVFDGASVPRAPITYWIAGGRAWAPSCLHDYGYQHPDEDDRELWDNIFHEAMGVNQPDLGHEAESKWVRTLMWAAVRAGGWWPWNDHRRALELNPAWSTTGWPENA